MEKLEKWELVFKWCAERCEVHAPNAPDPNTEFDTVIEAIPAIAGVGELILILKKLEDNPYCVVSNISYQGLAPTDTFLINPNARQYWKDYIENKQEM